MTFNPAWGQDGSTYDGEDMRVLVEALTTAGFSGGVTRVMGASHLAVTAQASPNNTVRAAAGQAVVNATSSRGAYLIDNDASTNSPAIAPTSTNPRIDLIIARATAGVVALEVVQGVAAGSPSTPTVTGDDYITLSKITIPASTTNITNAMLTDQRTIASAPVMNVATVAELTDLSEGLVAYERDTNTLKEYTGAAWRILDEPWQSYTPAWTSVLGTGPVIGNGTRQGYYRRHGDVCDVQASLAFGSTTGGGSGALKVGLPFAAAGSGVSRNLLTCELYVPTNGGGTYMGYGIIDIGQSVASPYFPGAIGPGQFANTPGGALLHAPWDSEATFGSGPGTGVPYAAGAYTVQVNGGFNMAGSYRIAQ